MAITYIGTNGIFTHIGSVVAQVNLVDDEIQDWTDRETAIQSVFDAGGQQVAESSLIGTVTAIQGSIAGVRSQLAQICDARLQDFTTVIDELSISSNSVSSVLSALIYQMIADSQTINASTVTLGSIVPGGSNVGNGTILIDATLDGISSPNSSVQPHPKYAGLLSQFSVNDTLTVQCATDSYSESLTSGLESFSWNGTVGLNSKWDQGIERAGQGPSITTLQAGSILSNMDFESFSVVDTPDSWNITAGVVTTNVAQSTSAGNFYRGVSAVKLIGTGVAAITINQPISSRSVKPLGRYACSVRYKASGTEGSGGKTFSVQLTGTGYSAGATEKVSIAGGSLATSWTLASFFVNIPANPPSDLAMTISLSGTPTVTVYVDDMGFDQVTYFNGICCVAVAGSTPFVKGDSFVFTVANDQVGVFQEFFRRNYLVQLPSVTDSSETIPDGLAI